MKKVLLFFYSIYGILSFLLLNMFMIAGYIVVKYTMSYPRQIRGVYFVNRIGIFIWAAITGMRFNITGKEHVIPEQSYVVVSNHVNALDIHAVSYGCRAYAKPLYKKEIEKIPLLGSLFKIAAIPVDRSDAESRKASLAKMLSELRQGVSIHIFPEGTRNRSPNPLQTFHHGAFTLAIETNTPILPVVLTGYRHLNKPNSLFYQPGCIGVHHLPAVFPGELEKEEWHVLAEKVRSVMEAKILLEDDFYKQINVS